jgi:ribulose-phosphate 3-epimerase
MKHIIAPSILSADFANLQRDIEMLNESQAEWIHVDVMDGVFVPNISFGFPVLKAVKKYAKKPLDVHLMIVNPEKYIEEFASAGADIITVHYEACTHLHRVIQSIKNTGCKAGVALNPHTPIEALQDVIADLDLVLIMSVNPGFGGQQFIPNSLTKIKAIKQMAELKNPKLIIEVDGGINELNMESVIRAGASAIVAGNAIFAANDPIQTIAHFNNININLSSV